MSKIQLGELTAGRQALEGADLAWGTPDTLRQLRARPQVPRDPIPAVLDHVPPAPFQLDRDKFGANLRSAKRGTAGGPSGMTAEHLKLLLDSPADMHLFFREAEMLARGEIPDGVARIIRRGRMTALQKAGGGVRGIVAGDIVRRLVARTISQQLSSAVESATAPFQYALSIRAGCECVAHVLQALCEVDERATIMSIDGISAYDLISRRAMLSGLAQVDGGREVLPFVKSFYGAPSHDAPVVLSRTTQRVCARFRKGCSPTNGSSHSWTTCTWFVCQTGWLQSTRCWRTRCGSTREFECMQGKTKIYNRAGERPEACDHLERIARTVLEDARVWRGGADIPEVERGIKVLGTPLGHPLFVQHQLARVRAHQQVLLDRIPAIPDVQSAWALPFPLRGCTSHVLHQSGPS